MTNTNRHIIALQSDIIDRLAVIVLQADKMDDETLQMIDTAANMIQQEVSDGH